MSVPMVALILTNYAVTIYAAPPRGACVLKNSMDPLIADVYLQPVEYWTPLPLVLFENGTQLEDPQDIEEAWIRNGRILEGTTFLAENSEKQIFFCSKYNDENSCVIPNEFPDSAPLQCLIPPVVLPINYTNEQCGHTGGGTPISFVYNICEAEGSYEYEKSHHVIYTFCYERSEGGGKNLHTSHFILSPKLLKSPLLIRERRKPATIAYIEMYPMENYSNIYNSIQAESTSGVEAVYPEYQVQQLVPHEDMAFYNLRNATYASLNYEFQRKDIFPIWNKMNQNVRKRAIQMDQYTFYIRTGVFDLLAIDVGYILPYDGKNIYNTWVKLIVAQPKTNYSHLPRQGIAILMNNFISDENLNPEVEMAQNTTMDRYCSSSVCAIQFKNKVASVGGTVRCCETSRKILELFSAEDEDEVENPELMVLSIPGVVRNPN